MNKFIFIIIITFSSFYVSAQKALIDAIVPNTILINLKSGGSSSGVIVCDSSFVYLVTARHCLVNRNKDGTSSVVDTLADLIYYMKDAFGSKSDTLQVNLNIAVKQNDLLIDLNNDIAILSIAKINGYTSIGNPIFTYNDNTVKLSKVFPGVVSTAFCLDFDKVEVGDDCTIIGYPSSLQLAGGDDYDFQRPLLRKGAIAGKNRLKGSIIVDCPSYQGNSGGPVFATSSYDKANIGLIGIVSRTILQAEQSFNTYYKSTNTNYSNSGYTVIVPIECAKTLMDIYIKLTKAKLRNL